MTEWLAQFFTQPRFRAALFSAFGALALFLAAVGIYGAIWQSVSQRTQEIGIRMAVGAQPRDVLNMIVGEGMRVVLLGLGTGIAGAIVLARALRNLLYGVQPTDPGILALTCLILLTIACVACFIPARRAIAIDPIDALRHE